MSDNEKMSTKLVANEEEEYEYEEILISIPLPPLDALPSNSITSTTSTKISNSKTIKFLDEERPKIKFNF